MNITQKKYAINRAYEIITQKCKDLIKELRDKINDLKEEDSIDLKTIAEMIRNNELKLLPKTKINSNTRSIMSSLNWDLVDLYDFTPLRKAYKQTLLQSGIPKAEIKQRYQDREHIRIKHPDRSNEYEDFNVYSDDLKARINNAKTLLAKTADAIMLASEQEALDKIDALAEIKI